MVNAFKVKWSSRFKKDYRKMKRQGKDMSKLDAIIVKIANREPLAEAQHDHELSNNWANHRECHTARAVKSSPAEPRRTKQRT